MAEPNESGSEVLFRAARTNVKVIVVKTNTMRYDCCHIHAMPCRIRICQGFMISVVMKIQLIFDANALNAKSDREICGSKNATTDALFVAAPFICTLWWLHLQMAAIGDYFI